MAFRLAPAENNCCMSTHTWIDRDVSAKNGFPMASAGWLADNLPDRLAPNPELRSPDPRDGIHALHPSGGPRTGAVADPTQVRRPSRNNWAVLEPQV